MTQAYVTTHLYTPSDRLHKSLQQDPQLIVGDVYDFGFPIGISEVRKTTITYGKPYYIVMNADGS